MIVKICVNNLFYTRDLQNIAHIININYWPITAIPLPLIIIIIYYSCISMSSYVLMLGRVGTQST